VVLVLCPYQIQLVPMPGCTLVVWTGGHGHEWWVCLPPFKVVVCTTGNGKESKQTGRCQLRAPAIRGVVIRPRSAFLGQECKRTSDGTNLGFPKKEKENRPVGIFVGDTRVGNEWRTFPIFNIRVLILIYHGELSQF